MIEEEWRDAVGHEGLFQVSSHGRVLSKRTGRVLKPTVSDRGYLSISTKVGGRSGKYLVVRIHRMVAATYLPPPSETLAQKCAAEGHGQVIVRHLDGRKAHNMVGNLAWGSSQDNTDDFAASEQFEPFVRSQSGPKNHNAKVSPEMVASIRARYKKGCRMNGARAIAAELGLHHTNVARIAGQRSYTLNV